MRLIRGALAAAALALLGACSSSSGPQPAELTPIPKPKEVRLLWSANVGSAAHFAFSPAVVEGTVYAAARDGTVVAVNAANGEARWRQALELKLSGGVGADAGTVAVASEEGEVVALDAATGKPRWRARVSSEVLAPPALAEGLVLVRTIDNRVFAFGVDDGKRRWVYQRAPSSLVVRTPAGLVVRGGLVFAGFSGGRLAAIAVANGGLRWEATVTVPKGATELERVADVIGDPAVQGREVCAAAYRGRVGCFEAGSGRPLWVRELVALSGVGVDAGYAYVADERGALHALDRSNGQSVWKQDKLGYRQPSQPLALGDTIAVGDFEGYVHFIARDSGAFIARYGTGGGAVRAAPVPFEGGLLIQTEDGELFALRL